MHRWGCVTRAAINTGQPRRDFLSRAEQGKGPVSGFDHSGRRGFAFVRFGAEHLTHDRGEITESLRAVAVESGAVHGGERSGLTFG